ncbi:MAG: Sir2 silent information regulator family NAD-dependent deacetylase [Eubacteriales bacterium]|nr:Sir2 silent information regulator family NAD-dependent deacetylase [Eubacteriales bacterium]
MLFDLKNKSTVKDNTTEHVKKILQDADAILIGAGAGLSTSAGFIYEGNRFETYFYDFIKKYHFQSMYVGGFQKYETLEEHWAYWSRFIYINRYMDAPKRTYENIFRLVKNKDYFVLTTNVDHCFQKSGFDKKRLFYTQGDYGLFQCSDPCHDDTYDNENVIRKMVLAQGFEIEADGTLVVPEDRNIKMTIPSEVLPRCPKCGKPMTMNLRSDQTFVQDGGWDTAASRYDDFVRRHRNTNIVYLELGVGYNTPSIIKYNFWQQTYQNPKAQYICMNYGQAYAPEEIEKRSICLDGDIDELVKEML